MDPAKIQTIVDWPQPTTLTELRSFLGLASFYKRFIQDFSDVVAPLTDLTKTKTFVWSDIANKAFAKLKKHLTSAHVLVLLEWSLVFLVSSDSSKTGSSQSE